MGIKRGKVNMFQEILWFLIAIILLIVGVVILLPLLKGYGIIWMIAALIFAYYHGYNVFSKKKIFIWETPIIKEKNE